MQATNTCCLKTHLLKKKPSSSELSCILSESWKHRPHIATSIYTLIWHNKWCCMVLWTNNTIGPNMSKPSGVWCKPVPYDVESESRLRVAQIFGGFPETLPIHVLIGLLPRQVFDVHLRPIPRSTETRELGIDQQMKGIIVTMKPSIFRALEIVVICCCTYDVLSPFWTNQSWISIPSIF